MTVFAGNNAGGELNDSWVLYSPGISGLACSATPLYGTVRAEGITEQVGNVRLYCTGGIPTPAGKPIPQFDVTLSLNTDVTSRLLPQAAGLSEALLFIDFPNPATPSPPGAQCLTCPSQILCTPLGSECAETGTGGSPSPYQTQPNVFAGKQYGASTLYWIVPIDPPGVNNSHILTLTNLRANAFKVPTIPGQPLTYVEAVVGIEGSYPISVVSGPQQLDDIQKSLVSAITSASIPQCRPHNAVLLGGSGTAAFDFNVQVSEGRATFNAFKFRNWGTVVTGAVLPALAEQNEVDYPYGTETGFYSPSLFLTAPNLGLANFGTRIVILLGPVSAGTHIFVPTSVDNHLPTQLQLVQADQYGNSAPGYEPVSPTATIGTTPVAEASLLGGLAYAVYEVINSGPTSIDTATIPVAVAFLNSPSAGASSASVSLAPLSVVQTASESAPIPRFGSLAMAQPAYAITACPK